MITNLEILQMIMDIKEVVKQKLNELELLKLKFEKINSFELYIKTQSGEFKRVNLDELV